MPNVKRTTLASVFIVLVLTACSESPVVPGSSANDARQVAARQTAVAGVYGLAFLDHSLQPVTTLTVGGPELILKAHVTDAFGNPAQRGTVEFQYCSLKGGPPNDINRADETPSADCLTNSASWARLASLSVDSNGNAFLNFGYVSIPRTIGFRFKYSSQGSGIASGISAPQDFTWIAAN
jgi:hypothetical protein